MSSRRYRHNRRRNEHAAESSAYAAGNTDDSTLKDKFSAGTTLARLGRYGGLLDHDGEILPLIIPHGEPEQMEFDREVCAAGIKKFVRPLLTGPLGDYATASSPTCFKDEMKDTTHLRIDEVRPGMRMKKSVFILKLPS